MNGSDDRRSTRRGGAERREETRHTRLQAVRATQQKPHRDFDCILRDISEHGCRLVGVDIDTIHAPFVLTIGPWSRVCDVAWRSKKTIGVHFLEKDLAVGKASAG